jgi:hypothetical protein
MICFMPGPTVRWSRSCTAGGFLSPSLGLIPLLWQLRFHALAALKSAGGGAASAPGVWVGHWAMLPARVPYYMRARVGGRRGSSRRGLFGRARGGPRSGASSPVLARSHALQWPVTDAIPVASRWPSWRVRGGARTLDRASRLPGVGMMATVERGVARCAGRARPPRSGGVRQGVRPLQRRRSGTVSGVTARAPVVPLAS